MELADTSAWTSKHLASAVATDFDARIEDGEIATCDMVKLELLWSARDTAEFQALRGELEALVRIPIEPRTWERALDVFEALAGRGPLHHRQVKIPDLLVAAAAEIVGMPVCHYDDDFEQIAAVTGQAVRAIAPLGSLN